MAVDGEGNIYAAGIQTNGGDTEILVIKLDPAGEVVWTYAGMPDSEANAIALLPNGDLAIAGSTPGMMTGRDALVLRLAADGSVAEWTATHDGPGSLDDSAGGVAVDSGGNIIARGAEIGDQAQDAMIWKLDGDGNEAWVTVHAGDAMQDDFATAVAVDSGDNAVVVGFVDATATESSAFVAKYAGDGTETWFSLLTPESIQFMRGVAVDGEDNAVIAGRSGDAAALQDYVAKYDSSGNQSWELLGSGPDSYARSVAFDLDGDPIVAGWVNIAEQFFNVRTRKLSTADGTEIWSVDYDNEDASLDDIGNGVAVDGDGGIIVVGLHTVIGQGTNAWARKYSPG